MRRLFETLLCVISAGCLASCQMLIGADEEHTLGECEPGERRCNGNTPEICTESRTWSGGACPTEAPVCSEGECASVVDVAAGSAHSCAVLSDGTARCWGHNNAGQLGIGAVTDVEALPVQVKGLRGVRSIAIGGSDDFGHTCAVLEDGSVACWGRNQFFQLGDGTGESASEPRQVPGLVGVNKLTLGFGHSCALLDDGRVACWGWNVFGQAGQDTAGKPVVGSPEIVQGIEGVMETAAGALHTCVIMGPDRSVHCWGDNRMSQCGAAGPDPIPAQDTYRVPDINSPRRLAAGYYHTCAIDGDGRAACWGRNDCGQLGTGDPCGPACLGAIEPFSCSQTAPSHLEDVELADVALGAHHSCLLSGGLNNLVKCWGRDDFAQTGADPEQRIYERGIAHVPVPTLNSLNHVVALRAGSYHSCALFDRSSIMCWGRNDKGQLGRGSRSDSGPPASVEWAP